MMPTLGYVFGGGGGVGVSDLKPYKPQTLDPKPETLAASISANLLPGRVLKATC